MSEDENKDDRIIGLPEEVKRRIVVELACFVRPPEIMKILKDEYGITHIERRNLFRYDASKSYSSCGGPLTKLFHETRKDFVEGKANLFVQHQAYRLRRLQGMSEKAEAQGNFKLAAELLEQASKDVGGIFTNVRKMEGDFTHTTMTVDEARAKVETIRARQAAQKAGPTIQ